MNLLNYIATALGLSLQGLLAVLLLTGFLTILLLLLIVPIITKHYQKRLKVDQNRFVSLASHYLITPISIIQAATSRLGEAEVLAPGERDKLYTAIQRGERRLWLTVQQLITVNALTTETLQLDSRKPADLNEVIQGAIDQVYPFAQERGIAVRFENLSHTSTQTHLDLKYTTLAVSAILDNSIKFSPDKAEVVISLEAGQWDKEYIVKIRDIGSGMPADVRARAGERFYRGSELYTFDHEGFGLGLYIARTLINMQDGSFEVASSPGKGTEITLRFPV